MGGLIHNTALIFVWITMFASGVRKDLCERCMKIEECPSFSNLTRNEQQMWLEQVPCDGEQSTGKSSFVTTGDNVCCPLSNIWDNQNENPVPSSATYNEYNAPYNEEQRPPHKNNTTKILQQSSDGYPASYVNQNHYDNLQTPVTNRNIFSSQQQTSFNQDLNSNHQTGEMIPTTYRPYSYQPPINDGVYGNIQRGRFGQNFYGNQQNGPDVQGIYENQQNILFNQGIYGNQQNRPEDQNMYENQQNDLNTQNAYEYQQPFPGGVNIYNANGQSQPNSESIYGQIPNNIQYQTTEDTLWNNVDQPRETVDPGQIQSQKPGFLYQNPNSYPRQKSPQYNNRNVNLFDKPNVRDKCEVQTSLLPDPQTGCCGRDMSNTERITDLQSLYNIFGPSNRNRQTTQPPFRHWSWPRFKRSTDDSPNITPVLQNRITGGTETELDQYPWTALLKVTFDYGNKQALFSCGGSLISHQYVLTAGHCLYEQGAKVSDVKVILAEYDKRTFPRDCKSEIGQQAQCIDNVMMNVENIIYHAEYDDERLHNDIALIRLQGYAPYTRYIRPICLPTIDINSDDFANLPLAVAGWGRNGPYISDIKKSTVVHLVPQRECQESYPYLGKSHLCAAGRTGEDTCKGDSGGPLMMLFRGSYYLVGIVSGKRFDSPCGSTVPSLYTNVFRYVQWIENNIRN